MKSIQPPAPRHAPALIIGAGPAGLSAAYELAKGGMQATVLEASGVVGGISRTVEYKGYLFDIGGHRFYTKVALVDRMWREILGECFLTRPRLSRIFYKRKFFHYPLEPWNALFGLGVWESILCGLSYAKSHLFPVKPEADFATWVSNRFGRRLFQTFFESYTEKVWGMPCTKIKAEWAAQRIQGLSLFSVVWNAFKPKKALPKDRAIKTLIHQFEYPRRGPGMMWERCRELVEAQGSKVEFHAPVEKIFWEPGRVTGVLAGGKVYSADHFVSTMPLRDLIAALEPAPPQLAGVGADFNYRDFLTVALVVEAKDLFPDNWIYVHEPKVKVGRIQNYKNWSPEMVPDPEKTCLGLEYFCFEGDGLWTMSDADLIALGSKEVAQLGLIDEDHVVDGTVVRVPKAYPVYDDTYLRGQTAVRKFLSEMLPNLQVAGRNGMHRYNNQDHSMLTAVLAARNILGGNYDLWQVNADEDYIEAGATEEEEDFQRLAETQPKVPEILRDR
jgi:protoporphyrinogen oxidase